MKTRKDAVAPRRDAAFAAADVIDLTHDGRGVARVNGKAVFIAGALPGERVRLRYVRHRKDYDEAELVSFEKASPQRVVPECSHFGICGGCVLQHLETGAQWRYRQKVLLDALERIGGLQPREIAEPLQGRPWQYRRRARLAVQVSRRGVVTLGFRQRDDRAVVAVTHCPVLDGRLDERLPELGHLVASLELKDAITHIEAVADAHLALVLRVLREPAAADVERLVQFQKDFGVLIYLQTGGPETARPLMETSPPLLYSPDGGVEGLHYAPTDFLQSNTAVAQAAVRQSLEWLQAASGERMLELFSGVGNFSIPLARRGVRLTAIEGDPALVARARENAIRLHLPIVFHLADLFSPDAHDGWWKTKYDAVLLDPPRAGAEAAIPLLAATQADRILYVSCNPATLARDAAGLGAAGYVLRRVGVIDMFPHTAHVESMSLFEKPTRKR